MFGVREKLKEVRNDDKLYSRELHASGKLLFWIDHGYHKKEWGIGKTEIEELLLHILYYLENLAAKEKIYKLNSKIINWHAKREKAIQEAKQALIDKEFSMATITLRP